MNQKETIRFHRIAASVYNALTLKGAMTPSQLCEFLRENFSPELGQSEIDQALRQLHARGWTSWLGAIDRRATNAELGMLAFVDATGRLALEPKTPDTQLDVSQLEGETP